MDTTLADEILSINAIYGDDTFVTHSQEPLVYLLRLPSLPGASFKFSFPSGYPDSPPKVLGTETLGSGKLKAGQGRILVERIHDILSEIHQPGQCCIYDLIEECSNKNITLPTADEKESSRKFDFVKEQQQQEVEQQRNDSKSSTENIPAPPQASQGTFLNDFDSIPAWTLSEPIREKKSVFIARVATVHSPTQARRYLDNLLASDKKVARATHNINAWRIRCSASTSTSDIATSGNNNTSNKKPSNEITYQDSDDDGETAAGTRLLHLLQLMDAWNVIVVVTRWYGGVQLGPDRFRIINVVAREALVKAGAVAVAGAGVGARAGAGIGKKGRKGECNQMAL